MRFLIILMKKNQEIRSKFKKQINKFDWQNFNKNQINIIYNL